MPEEDFVLFKMALSVGNMDLANEIIKDFIELDKPDKKVVDC